MNKKRIWSKIALLAILCFTVASCGDEEDEIVQEPVQQEQEKEQEKKEEKEEEKEEPKGPICTPSSLTMKAAIHERDCEAYITVTNDSTCTFKSENEYVAVVDSATGFVKSLYCGKTNIVVTGKTGTTKVPVNVNPVYNTFPVPTFGWNTNFNKVKTTYGSKAFEIEPTAEGNRRLQVNGLSAKAPYATFVFNKSYLIDYYGIITKKEFHEETMGFLYERYVALGDLFDNDQLIFAGGFNQTNFTTQITFLDYPQEPYTYDLTLFIPLKMEKTETRATQLQANPAIMEYIKDDVLKTLEGIEIE